jgi:tight adherence protein C
MVAFVLLVTFLVTVFALMVLVYASGPEVVDVARRLTRVLKPPVTEHVDESAVVGSRQAKNVLISIGKLLPESTGTKVSRDQVLLTRAGYRSEDAGLALNGIKLLCAGLFTFLIIWSGLSETNPIFFPLIAAGIGWVAPEFWLQHQVRARQKRLRLSLPDAMDLMVICVEVGLGLDQGLQKVADELELVHPELSMELQMVGLEMRVGKTRIEALRELAQRTGLDDIKALVAILVQTD